MFVFSGAYGVFFFSQLTLRAVALPAGFEEAFELQRFCLCLPYRPACECDREALCLCGSRKCSRSFFYCDDVFGEIPNTKTILSTPNLHKITSPQFDQNSIQLSVMRLLLGRIADNQGFFCGGSSVLFLSVRKTIDMTEFCSNQIGL